MKTIQIIDLDGRPAALAADGAAIIAKHVAPALLAHVQAKALYALQIQAGERPGPYTDSGAERYARSATATTAAPALRLRPGSPRRGAHRQRRP
jgi:hypothetical protein